MKIGVIGRGVIGSRVEELFAGHAEVVAWDITDDAPYPACDLHSCQCVVICVGTPPGPSGHADISSLEAAIQALPNERIVIKSTVPPGTTDRLAEQYGRQICYWPEFTSESQYSNPHFPESIETVPFVILGGQPAVTSWMVDLLLPVLGPTKRYFQCPATDAELIKYADNVFFATKITFANEFRRICDALGGDWHRVREGWLLDPRISPMHTAAFRDDPGFGGKCLPKDLGAVLAAASDAGYNAEFLAEVQRSNERFRQREDGFKLAQRDCVIGNSASGRCVETNHKH